MNFNVVSAPELKPRQFEYHPTDDKIIYGTVDGEVALIDTIDYTKYYKVGIMPGNHNILGLNWFNTNPMHFFVGNSNGDISHGIIDNPSTDTYPQLNQDMFFEKLTSIHLNCDDTRLVVSGYSKEIKIFDVQTNSVVETFSNAHDDNINITRFSKFNPYIFSSVSHDTTCKTWDLRMSNSKPIYTINCGNNLTMLTISPDDNYLLISGKDNDVNQYLLVDGKHHLKYDIPKSGSSRNYTRSYYTSSVKNIISGSSDEPFVNILSSTTGELIRRDVLYPGRQHASLYVQSLRASPRTDNEYFVLVNYREYSSREIVRVSFDDNSSDSSPKSFKQNMLDKFYKLNNHAICNLSIDIIRLKIRDQLYYVHKSIISCRSPVLYYLIEKYKENMIISVDEIISVIDEKINLLFFHFICYLYSDHIDINSILKIAIGQSFDTDTIDSNIFDIGLCKIWIKLTSVHSNLLINTIELLMRLAISFEVTSLLTLLDSILCEGLRINNVLTITSLALEYNRINLIECCKWFCISNNRLIDLSQASTKLKDFLELCSRLFMELCYPLKYSISTNFLSNGLYYDRTYPILSDTRSIISQPTSIKQKGGKINYIQALNEMNTIPLFRGNTVSLVNKNTVLVLGGHNTKYYYDMDFIFCFDINLQVWSHIKTYGPHPVFLSNHRVISCIINSTIYLIMTGGGINLEEVDNPEKDFQYVLNCDNFHWSKPSVNMLIPQKKLHATATFNNYHNTNLKCFVIIGGHNILESIISNDVIVGYVNTLDGKLTNIQYNIAKIVEDSVPRRYGAAALAISSTYDNSDKILLFGGSDFNRVYNDIYLIECNDFKTMTCRLIQATGNPCPPIYNHELYFLNPKTIIILGGTFMEEQPISGIYLIHLEFDLEDKHILGIRWDFIETQYLNMNGLVSIKYEQSNLSRSFGNIDFQFSKSLFMQFGSNFNGQSKVVSIQICENLVENDDIDKINVSVNDISDIRQQIFHTPWQPVLQLHDSSYTSDLIRLSKNNLLIADFNISLASFENERFSIHKCFLDNSDLFTTLLQPDKSFIDCIESSIIIQDISPNILDIIRLFLYTGNLYCDINDIFDVLSAADQFIIQKLIILCEGVLINELINSKCHIEEYLSVALWANKYSLETLRTICFSYFLREIGKGELSDFVDINDSDETLLINDQFTVFRDNCFLQFEEIV